MLTLSWISRDWLNEIRLVAVPHPPPPGLIIASTPSPLPSFAMDPVSFYVGFVASVGTLIQLSEIVVEYLRNTAGAKEEKKKLITEIVSTRALLDELRGKAKPPTWNNTVEMMERPDGPLQVLESVLKKLEAKAKPSNNRFVKVTSRFIFHFEKGEYEEVLREIGTSKANFMMVLGLYCNTSAWSLICSTSDEDLMAKLKGLNNDLSTKLTYLNSKFAALEIGQNG
jgi:hypothetical protein